MNTRKERLIAEHGDDHPGLGSYLECMSRAYLTGVATFTIVFSTAYLAQNLVKYKLNYPSKFFILTSSAFGVISSFVSVKSRSAVCQSAWLAAEDKVTYFTELEKREETNTSG